MSMDKRFILDNLMEKGKNSGRLSTKDITDALEKLDFDVEQMDAFYDNCASLNIEIMKALKILLIFRFRQRELQLMTLSKSILKK